MPDQTEPGHIGTGADFEIGHDPGRLTIQGAHQAGGQGHPGFARSPAFGRGRHDACPDRFGQDEGVPGERGPVGQDPVGVHDPGDRHPELGLGVLDRVPAHDRHAGLGGLLRSALQDLLEHLLRQASDREADQVQGEDRLGPHGVDVAQGVGGGDGPEIAR